MENTRLHLLVKYRSIQAKLISNFSINEIFFRIPNIFRCTQIFIQTQTQKIANITLQMMKTVEYHICGVWVSIPKSKLNCIHKGIVKVYAAMQQYKTLETMSFLFNALIAFSYYYPWKFILKHSIFKVDLNMSINWDYILTRWWYKWL